MLYSFKCCLHIVIVIISNNIYMQQQTVQTSNTVELSLYLHLPLERWGVTNHSEQLIQFNLFPLLRHLLFFSVRSAALWETQLWERSLGLYHNAWGNLWAEHLLWIYENNEIHLPTEFFRWAQKDKNKNKTTSRLTLTQNNPIHFQFTDIETAGNDSCHFRSTGDYLGMTIPIVTVVHTNENHSVISRDVTVAYHLPIEHQAQPPQPLDSEIVIEIWPHAVVYTR